VDWQSPSPTLPSLASFIAVAACLGVKILKSRRSLVWLQFFYFFQKKNIMHQKFLSIFVKIFLFA